MVAPEGWPQSTLSNDLSWQTGPRSRQIARRGRNRLANLSGAPPADKNEAPDPAATGSSAKNPCQAGGSKLDSTNGGARKPRPVLTVRFDQI